MPKPRGIDNKIAAIYRKNTLSLLCFGYVRGCKSALHTLTVDQCISLFMKEFDLTEEDFNSESARVEYGKMQKLMQEIIP